jgi:hypothetical protein
MTRGIVKTIDPIHGRDCRGAPVCAPAFWLMRAVTRRVCVFSERADTQVGPYRHIGVKTVVLMAERRTLNLEL